MDDGGKLYPVAAAGPRTAQSRATNAFSSFAIRASEGSAGHPRLGPASVGHTARFVIDHAPCDVLLLRGE